MPAKKFIAQLEAQGLLAPEIVEELRRQVDESKSRITPATLARLLVENGHLTKFQATKLISEMSKDAPGKADARHTQRQAEEELGLAPQEGEKLIPKALILDNQETQVSAAEIIDDDEEVDVVEIIDDDMIDEVEIIPEDDEVEVVEVIDAPPARSSKSAKSSSRSSGATRSGQRVTTSPSPLRAPITKLPSNNTPTKSGNNPWDSHRILTVGVVLALLLVAGAWLGFNFLRGNAKNILDAANEAYKPNNYETAIKKYETFTQNFPSHSEASFARVRLGLARIRKDIENQPDPTDALKTAENVLPALVKEPALASERGDVAGALVNLAQKFNQRADNAAQTATKKTLMSDMEKVTALLNDAQYVGNSARQEQGIAIKSIEEDRKRILRDISREEDLQTSLQKIDAKLKENATTEAYQIRSELINRFPQLEREPGVMARVQEAARIQQNLVVADSPEIKTSGEAPAAPQTRTVALANRTGTEIASMADRVLCVRAKGSVYGLDGQTGNVKWRYFVGRDMADDPVPVTPDAGSDIVVCRPDVGHLTRLEGATGNVKWFSELGSSAFAPRIDTEDMMVSLRSGTLLNIEPETGQLKWASKLPQSLQLSPNVNGEKPNIYLPADHSNLYVLSRLDGKCKEVYYVGHRAGSIVVPPIHLYGQLFVFENRTTDRAVIRILQTDDSGLKLTPVQDPIEVEGNVVTPPLVDGRKLLVLSDRGQIKVIDIEPASDKNKVSVIASEVASESKPTMNWGVTENNQLWLVNYRFTRWDVQVSTGKLLRPWIKDDGDQFVGPPHKYGDILVHSRVVRGNRGVRVTAVKADDGAVQWMTDLGVPVVLLASPSAGRFDAVTTSGAQFAIDATQTQLNQAESNTDSFKPGMNYENPRYLPGGTAVLHNISVPNRIISYTPGASGNRLKSSSANFGSARPTAPPAPVGESVAFGLDNGQLVIIDPSTGASVSNPFQPPVEPGKKHAWNQPVYWDEGRALFAADSRRKLYRFAVAETLRALSDVDLEGSVVGPLALTGKHVALVLTNQTDESLLAFDTTSLTKTGTTALDGRWQSGPFGIDSDHVLVQTDRKLQAFGPGASLVWSVDFPSVRLAAAPVVGSTGIALAATNGKAWLIDPKTGATQSELDVQQPLSAAPLAVPGGMLLGTDEGTVLLMRLTEPSAPATNTTAKEPQ